MYIPYSILWIPQFRNKLVLVSTITPYYFIMEYLLENAVWLKIIRLDKAHPYYYCLVPNQSS